MCLLIELITCILPKTERGPCPKHKQHATEYKVKSLLLSLSATDPGKVRVCGRQQPVGGPGGVQPEAEGRHDGADVT